MAMLKSLFSHNNIFLNGTYSNESHTQLSDITIFMIEILVHVYNRKFSF